MTVTSPPARSSSEVAIRPSSSRRVAAGIRLTTTSRIRSWASRVVPPSSIASPRSTRSAVARSASIRGPADQALELERVDRPAEDRERPEQQVGIGSRAPASWPRRPRRRRARRPRPRRAGRARTASRRPAPTAPTPRPLRSRPGWTTSRTPSSRSSGRTCRVTTGDSSPMTVASDAAKRSVTGEGRDATTSARPRPEPAVARTRKWHRASESGSTHWRSSTNRAAARCRASWRWTDSKIRMASRPPTSAPGSSRPWNVRSSLVAASRRSSGDAAASGTLDSGS